MSTRTGKTNGQSYRATAAAGLGAAGNSSAALGTGIVHICDFEEVSFCGEMGFV